MIYETRSRFRRSVFGHGHHLFLHWHFFGTIVNAINFVNPYKMSTTYQLIQRAVRRIFYTKVYIIVEWLLVPQNACKIMFQGFLCKKLVYSCICFPGTGQE